MGGLEHMMPKIMTFCNQTLSNVNAGLAESYKLTEWSGAKRQHGSIHCILRTDNGLW